MKNKPTTSTKKQFILTNGNHVQITVKKLNGGRYYEAVSSEDSSMIAIGEIAKGKKVDVLCTELVESAENGTLFI